MPSSRITPTKQYSEDLWVISVINSVPGLKGLIDGHSAIVVEGLENGKPFIAQYDIAANGATEEKCSPNTKGMITKIKCFENENNKRDYTKENYFSGSAYASPAEAKRMILSIKADEVRTAQAMENLSRPGRHLDEQKNPVTPIPYQRLGKDHALVKVLGNTAAGDNCTGWCAEKLAIAGINVTTLIPKPKVLPVKLKCHGFFNKPAVRMAMGVVATAVAVGLMAYKS